MSLLKRAICPECGSSDVIAVAGTEAVFMCRACGYSGPMQEKSVIGRGDDDVLPVGKKRRKR